MRKSIAIVCLVLAASILQAGLYGNFKYRENDDGTLTIYEYFGEYAQVEVPEKIHGKQVAVIGDQSFASTFKRVEGRGINRVNSMETIVLPPGLTTIGKGAFKKCKQLKSVDLPAGLRNIGAGAFSSCQKLEEINIPNTVTNIGNRAFSGSGLKLTVIPPGIGEIKDDCFNRCNFLKEVELPAGIRRIGDHAFHGCSRLESISIPEAVTNIGENAFAECPLLRAVKIPAGISEIGFGAFAGCKGLDYALFTGDAPSKLGSYALGGFPINFTVAYYEGAKGFTEPNWEGYRSKQVPSNAHLLIVNRGSGTGVYTNGAVVEIEAQPPFGKGFEKWSGDTDTCAASTAYKTEFIMPNTDAVIRADCADISEENWDIKEHADETVTILGYKGNLEKVTKPATIGEKKVRHRTFSSNEDQWDYMAKKMLAGERIPGSWSKECHKQFLEYFKEKCKKNETEAIHGFSAEDNAEHYVNAIKMSIINPERHIAWPFMHPGRRRAYDVIKKNLASNTDELDLLVGIIIPAIENDETKIAVAAYKKLEKVDKDWARYIQNLVLYHYNNSPAAKSILENMLYR